MITSALDFFKALVAFLRQMGVNQKDANKSDIPIIILK